MNQKSYNGTPTLYLVPTPIGNLEDITIRSLNILKETDVIFCEDTRVTLTLLNHFDIKKKLIASHDHNEEQTKQLMVDYLEKGKNIAIVTDRGTPIISDPGYKGVQYVIEKGYNVVGLPGPTALIPALIVSGIEPSPFLFYGFLDNKKTKREKELLELKELKTTIIFYESPHRIKKTMQSLLNIWGNRKISISREISKKFEEIYRGNIEDFIDLEAKGEFVLVIEGNKQNYAENKDVFIDIEDLIEEGYTKNQAIGKVSKKNKIDRNDLYKKYLNRK
ncbi:MAG: 16S rRNA (cytidine(1402)-2'-O)-methyltransferase [Mollicutes bacterium]|nr:16S rRNA (cytidine(1402)-2'-O)-methyltransferase [Mollicutes bacterium]